MPPAAIAGGIAAHKAATARDRKGGPPPGTTRTFQDPTLTDTGYDPNRFEYGGRPGVGEEAAGRFANMQKENAWKANTLFDQAGEDRNLSLQARGGQVQAANLMLDRAQGRNLVADRMAGTARRDLTSRMRSGAASAMGPAALANAQSDAMAAEAQGLGSINDAATTAGIQEKTAAEQAAFGAQTGIREGDLGSRNAGLGAGAQFGGLGVSYGGLENQVRANQNQVNVAHQQLLEGSKRGSDSLNVDVYNKGKQRDTEGLKMGLGAATSLAQAGVAASDPLAKSGIQTLGDDAASTDGPGDTNPDLAPNASVGTSPKAKKNPIGMTPMDMSSPSVAAPPPSLSITTPMLQQIGSGDGRGMGISDPKAKKEAFELGQAVGAARQDSIQPGQAVSQATGAARQDSIQPGQAVSQATAARSQANSAKPVAATTLANGLLFPPSLLPATIENARAASKESDARKQELAVSDAGSPSSPTIAIQKEKEPKATPIDWRRVAGHADDAMSFLSPARMIARVSDPRAKELGGVHDNEVAQTLDETPAVSYKYKDDSFEPEAQRPGERQAGFLTTDLKKTPLGAAVVEQRPDGLEGYNEHRLNGLQHAEIRNVHERLRDVEALIAMLRGRHG
jgi:hypothetical protein